MDPRKSTSSVKSSKQIVTQPNEVIGDFVTRHTGESPGWGEHYETIGLIDKYNQLIAGVVYNRFASYQGKTNDCDMNIAAMPGTLWATPEFFHEMFYYPFKQLGCRRVNALVASTNEKSIKLVEHTGFSLDARIERGWPGCDLLIYGLFPENCRYI